MANEIQVSIAFQATKNGATAGGTYSGTLTMSGDQLISNVQIIGTSNEAITLGDVTATGVRIMLKNLDATNYVEIFSDSGNANLISKIPATESIYIQPNAAIYARANTSSINLLVVAVEA